MEIHLDSYLKDEAPQLSQWAEKVIAECSKRLKFEQAKINMHPSFGWEENGSSGYCPFDSEIVMSIDLASSNLNYETFCFALTRQLYFLTRRQAGIHTDGTFLECLISEGLADHFYFETYGEIPMWVSELDKTEATKLLKKAAPYLDEYVIDKLFNDWFTLGSKKLKIAKWSGYSLGYALVSQILKKDKKLNSISFLDVPVKEIADITVLYDNV